VGAKIRETVLVTRRRRDTSDPFLVLRLLKDGCRVKVLELYLYGPRAGASRKGKTHHCEEIKGDIRDGRLLRGACFPAATL